MYCQTANLKRFLPHRKQPWGSNPTLNTSHISGAVPKTSENKLFACEKGIKKFISEYKFETGTAQPIAAAAAAVRRLTLKTNASLLHLKARPRMKRESTSLGWSLDPPRPPEETRGCQGPKTKLRRKPNTKRLACHGIRKFKVSNLCVTKLRLRPALSTTVASLPIM